MEPDTIQTIQTSSFSKLYNSPLLINNNQTSCCTFARGYYSVGTDMLNNVSDQLRLLMESCNKPQGFCLFHSTTGGTGSGLGSLLLEKLCADYRKLTKLGFEVFPQETTSQLEQSVVEPYNALLSTHYLIEHANISVCFDNSAGVSLCENELKIKSPSYNDINGVMAKVVSGMTGTIRFETDIDCATSDLYSCEMALVSLPKIHFMTSSIAPLINVNQFEQNDPNEFDVVKACFEHSNFLIKLAACV